MSALRALLTSILALALMAPLRPARAEEGSIRGLKLVVPEAKGKAAYGKGPLTKSLRRALTDALGPLIPSKELAAAQKKLKQKGKKKTSVEGLLEAAKKTRAQYLLVVEISKERWLFTARAQLLNVETGDVQMDFKSQFFKPTTEAADRGRRIAARTLQKLDQLIKEGAPPFSGSGAVAESKPPPRAGRSEPQPADDDKLPAGDNDAPDLKDAKEPKREPDRREPEKREPDKREPPKVVAQNEPPKVVAQSEPPPRSNLVSSSAGTPVQGGVGTKVEIAPRPEEEGPELIRFGLNGGAGLLHTYDLSSSSVDNSRLSYRLQPVALLTGNVELILPGIPLGIAARAAFRPVRFQVTVDNATPPTTDTGAAPNPNPAANTPSGKFLDLSALVEGQFGVGGSGRNRVKLIPGVGFKVGILNVDQQPGNLIISSTELALIGAFVFRFPINDTLELDFGVDGGPVLSYKESPTNTGVSNGGYTIGADFQARIWLSSSIGIAFDTRFDYDRLKFSGTPSRLMVGTEMLADVSAAMKDLRTGVGIAFRL